MKTSSVPLSSFSVRKDIPMMGNGLRSKSTPSMNRAALVTYRWDLDPRQGLKLDHGRGQNGAVVGMGNGFDGQERGGRKPDSSVDDDGDRNGFLDGAVLVRRPDCQRVVSL